MICPTIPRNSVYKKALQNIYEYMGIENIIKRLQDIDKLKFVLFDKEQRKLFEILPKPGIAKKLSSHDSFYTIESVVKSKRENNSNEIDALQKLKTSVKNDPMNKRLIEMMESRKSMKETKPGLF